MADAAPAAPAPAPAQALPKDPNDQSLFAHVTQKKYCHADADMFTIRHPDPAAAPPEMFVFIPWPNCAAIARPELTVNGANGTIVPALEDAELARLLVGVRGVDALHVAYQGPSRTARRQLEKSVSARVLVERYQLALRLLVVAKRLLQIPVSVPGEVAATFDTDAKGDPKVRFEGLQWTKCEDADCPENQ